MSDQIFWLNYLFFVDFSADKTMLSQLTTGELSDTEAAALAASLSNHDTGEGRALWTAQPAANWSLYKAKVVYNGPNQTGLPSNALYDHVTILEFPETSQGPVGQIVLNYNLNAPAV